MGSGIPRTSKVLFSCRRGAHSDKGAWAPKSHPKVTKKAPKGAPNGAKPSKRPSKGAPGSRRLKRELPEGQTSPPRPLQPLNLISKGPESTFALASLCSQVGRQSSCKLTLRCPSHTASNLHSSGSRARFARPRPLGCLRKTYPC